MADDDIEGFDIAPDNLVDPSVDLLAALDELTEHIQTGSAIGVIAIPIHRHGNRCQYYLRLSGTAATHLTYSAGAMDVCADLVRKMAQKQSGLV